MMKKNSLLFFALVIGHAAAEDHFDKGVLKVLKETNQQKVIPAANALCMPYVGNTEAEKKPTSQDMNECVQALCGSPSENKSVFFTNDTFEQYVTPELKKQLNNLEPKYKKLLEREKKENLKTLGEIEAKLKNPNLSKLTIEMRRTLSYKMFAPYMVEKVDLKKPLNERYSIELKDLAGVTPEFKIELMKFKESYLPFVKNDVDKFLEKGLYSEAEQRELFKERLLKMQNSLEPIISSMGKFEQDDIPKRIQGFLSEIEKPENPDLNLTLMNIANLEGQLNYYLKDKKLGFEPPDCSGETCDNFLKKYIQDSNLIPAVQKAKTALENDNQTQLMNRCKSQLVSKLSITSDQKKAEKLVNEVKAMMSKNVFSKFSAHSRKMLEDYFKKNIITSNKSLIATLSPQSPFDSLKEMSEAQLERGSESFPTSDEMALMEAANMAEGKATSMDTSNVCMSGLESNAYDAYVAWAKVKEMPAEVRKLVSKLPPKDHIFISPFSCHHDLRGKSVVAHELGHAINQIFATQKLSTESAKSYKKIRKCATENYTEFIPDRVMNIQQGDGLRTEEDTADLFAFMTYSSPDDLFQCALIKPSFDKKNYEDLSFITDDGDTHSTGLYRLVMEAINKKKALPVSCERALETAKADLRLKKCVP